MFHHILDVTQFHHMPQRGRIHAAWDTWRSYNEISATFLALSAGPDQVANEDIAVLELFTILLYDRTSDLVSIDEDKKTLFYQEGTSH